LQSRQAALPRYEVVSVKGEAHAQTFTVECYIELLSEHTTGKGPSRRYAEQQAAEEALSYLEQPPGDKS